MDPQSARTLRRAAKHPLGHVTTVLMKNYIEGHRSKSLLDTTIEEPEHRCIYPVTRGRCRKRVTDVALTQYCAKHQRRSCFATPGDKTLTHWNHHGLFQKEKEKDTQQWEMAAFDRYAAFGRDIHPLRCHCIVTSSSSGGAVHSGDLMVIAIDMSTSDSTFHCFGFSCLYLPTF